MSKRLTDTEKWKKPFLKGMDTVYKLFWLYILDNCDHAGIWQVEKEVAELRMNEQIDLNDAIKEFGDKIQVFDNGNKWFIPDFIEFQYGELNPDSKVHGSVLSILKKYKIKPYGNSIRTVKDKDKEKDKDIDKEINISFGDFWNLYDKKVDRLKCEPKWSALTDEDRTAIMSYIPKYKITKPEKKFRRDPATFLNNRTWENELIYEEDEKTTRPKGYKEWLDGRMHTPEKHTEYKKYLESFEKPLVVGVDQIGRKV